MIEEKKRKQLFTDFIFSFFVLMYLVILLHLQASKKCSKETSEKVKNTL